MIRAILFDCNGVISDDEMIHLKLFQKVLKEEGISLSKKEYFKKYLAMDDRSCFSEALKSHHLDFSEKHIKELILRKAIYYQQTIRREFRIFPGVKSFIKRHQRQCALAVVSGALRSEIDWILKKAGIRSAFSVIVSSEDVKKGKPNPESYVLGLKLLNRLPRFKKNPLKAQECLAIEDAVHGIDATHGAGMKCLAVTTSYSRKDLYKADCVVKNLAGVHVENLKLY